MGRGLRPDIGEDRSAAVSLGVTIGGAVSMVHVSSERMVPLQPLVCQSGAVKVRHIVRRLEEDGWFWVCTRGDNELGSDRVQATAGSMLRSFPVPWRE